jgi:hypothetical protein
MEKSVVYSYPLPAEAVEAERELARLEGIEGMEEARRALLDAMPEVERIRITVGSASAIEYARYNRMRREAADWFKAQTGVTPDVADDESVPDDVWLVMDIAIHRAYMLAVLRKYEVLRGPYAGDNAWEEIPLPEDWRSVEGMAQNVPAALFNAWLSAARECNPGLFWADTSESGK